MNGVDKGSVFQHQQGSCPDHQTHTFEIVQKSCRLVGQLPAHLNPSISPDKATESSERGVSYRSMPG